ncbi:MAG TPA: arginine--tRNA ligase [Candidatus Dormibacteraeota bacterium]|nr:arginine--tRNA ligase [Candidatus Dormibacteraeota bacterium]
MYQQLSHRLRAALAQFIQEKYGLEISIALERPPKIEMGEAASPVSFELAKRLKRAPRQIAQEIANGLGVVPGIARVEVAGAGYLNAFFDRGTFWSDAAAEAKGGPAAEQPGKIIVEHTSINPNKAAHIGHMRNAILGDAFIRILEHAGHRVQVQNYIDNTGVQVADVVIGFQHMEKKSVEEVRKLAAQPKFDYLCWDLYARVTQFFEEDKARAASLRGATLRAIEEDRGESAEMGKVIGDAIVTAHLRSMARLGISYDLLARESEILHLKFWDAAFAQLKEAGAIQLATTGKMAGCWIMPWNRETDAKQEDSDTSEEEINQDKIIVRSNGTVTYVGKDIAYQLWKFGLLGKDFHYIRWPVAIDGKVIWSTTTEPSDPAAPEFGKATSVYNVIDTRQAYLQNVVAAGLRALGHPSEADRSIHFAYEVVSLTPRCAAELGYEAADVEEGKKSTVEVSGRKGLGVKADDLIDKMEAATLAEVSKRQADMSTAEQKETAHTIAIGALRYFLLKFTRTSIIAFDFNDALSFEGDTGPYCQYAVVRIRGIRRKGVEAGATSVVVTAESAASILNGKDGNSLWEVLLLAGSLDYAVDAAIAAQEPAFIAKYCFQLAQAFNLFYHKHHILSEADEQKRAFLLRLTEIVEAQLVKALSLLGIAAPEKM